MRHALQALALALAALLAPAQVVEESIQADPGPLDFIQGDSYEQWILQSLAGDALVGIRPDGTLTPRLAARWTLELDGALLFTLRTDARFPDGRAVSAEDVLWTYLFTKNRKTVCVGKDIITLIRNKIWSNRFIKQLLGFKNPIPRANLTNSSLAALALLVFSSWLLVL